MKTKSKKKIKKNKTKVNPKSKGSKKTVVKKTEQKKKSSKVKKKSAPAKKIKPTKLVRCGTSTVKEPSCLITPVKTLSKKEAILQTLFTKALEVLANGSSNSSTDAPIVDEALVKK